MANINFESISDTYKALIAEGRVPTIRAIQARLGGGSLSTIHFHLKKIKEVPDASSFENEERFRPLLKIALELIKNASDEATRHLKAEIDELKNNLDDITKALALEELRNQEAMEIISGKDLLITELRTELKLIKQVTDNTTSDLNKTRNELMRMTIYSEDYLKAKSEAFEARERVAKLESQLAAIGKDLKKDTSVKSKTDGVENKKKTVKKPI